MTAADIKGYIGEAAGSIFFHDGHNVYRASPSSVVDATTGYLSGRWECDIATWNRFAGIVYGLPRVEKQHATS